MVERRRYEQLIREQINSEQVKIFTGAYRCGKSTMLKAVQRILRKKGIPLGDVLYVDFEAARHSDIRNGGALLFVVRNALRGSHRIYLLLDEIGNLPGWETALDCIREQYRCDIYLTGTRASLFRSGKELFGGNYLEIPVYPYSFQEYLEAERENAAQSPEEPEAYLQDYMIYGNMPGIHKVSRDQETVFSYLLDVCQAGVLQSVVRPWKLRNVDQIWMILGCAAENLGRPLSAKTAAQYLKEQAYPIGKDTVYTILRALTEAGILMKVPRYERKSGRTLEGQEKYYFTDWGMYHSLHGLQRSRTKALLENIVCMELAGRGWQVCRTQYREKEIDFLAQKDGEKRYLQVRERLTREEAYRLWKELPRDGRRTVIWLEQAEASEQSETEKRSGEEQDVLEKLGQNVGKSLRQFLLEEDEKEKNLL